MVFPCSQAGWLIGPRPLLGHEHPRPLGLYKEVSEKVHYKYNRKSNSTAAAV